MHACDDDDMGTTHGGNEPIGVRLNSLAWSCAHKSCSAARCWPLIETLTLATAQQKIQVLLLSQT